MDKPAETIEEVIARLERDGFLFPDCATCRDHFYPSLLAGKGMPFAPRHQAKRSCESGKRDHCTCDGCF